MTEADWLTSTAPDEMIAVAVAGRLSVRKWRLFILGCCRRRSELFNDRLAPLLTVAERFADREATLDELERAQRDHDREKTRPIYEYDERESWCEWTEIARDTAEVVGISCCFDHSLLGDPHDPNPVLVVSNLARAYALGFRFRYDETIRAELAAHATLLRCLVGNPFRPVTVPPNWRTSTVVGLASGIYADRAFDRLPMLADALVDAGCDQPDILTHCRTDGEHTRGCWVVDAVLDKS